MSSDKKTVLMHHRRDFLKSTLIGLGALSLMPMVQSCSSFDEYIFDDHLFLKDQVLIIGGGISGLFLAYKLRQLKTEFRVFEGSRQLGGRIRSQDGLDLGASLFNKTDENLNKLIKEFNLAEAPLSKSQFFLVGGADQLTKALSARVMGLVPYRNVRLRWRLAKIIKVKGNFEMTFDTPAGFRTLIAKKVALTIPPSQWSRVTGLFDLPEMAWAPSWLQSLKPETIFKLETSLPGSTANLSSLNKKYRMQLSSETEILSVVAKNLKNNMVGLEFELRASQHIDSKWHINSNIAPSMENYLALINAKTRLALSAKKIGPEAFFNWSDVDLIQSAYFRNSVDFPREALPASGNFQVFGDYSSVEKPHTVEGALLEANRISSYFV